VSQRHRHSFTSSKTQEAWYPTECLKGGRPRCLGRQEVQATLLCCLGICSNRTGAWTLCGSCDSCRTSHVVPNPSPIREPVLGLPTSHLADSREPGAPLYWGEPYGRNMEITKSADRVKHYVSSGIRRDSYKCEAPPPGTHPSQTYPIKGEAEEVMPTVIATSDGGTAPTDWALNRLAP